MENLFSGSTALSSFRDIANTNKHRKITQYSPSTDDVLTSAPPFAMSIAPVKLKVIRKDKSRLDAVPLGEQALHELEAYFKKHRL